MFACSSSNVSDTVSSCGVARATCRRSKGSLVASLLISSNALSASPALPVRLSNLMRRLSTSSTALATPLATLTAAKAPPIAPAAVATAAKRAARRAALVIEVRRLLLTSLKPVFSLLVSIELIRVPS